MTVGDIAAIIEGWAPREIAWERDNVGLQVGDMRDRVRAILVSLDTTVDVIDEARRKNANLLISHHPLFFRPVSSLTGGRVITECVRSLVGAKMNLYAAHTNLDFAQGGTSFALAEVLRLEGADLLQGTGGLLRKIVTYVPPESIDRVAEAMADAGAGRIGNYDQCSFRIEGEGTFRGGKGSRPTIGKAGKLERVHELRLEMIIDRWQTDRVIRAMKTAHPYEEVAFDIYPVENESSRYGAGVLGSLPRRTSLRNFLTVLKRALGMKSVRATGPMSSLVQRIALCGGSGSDLLETAIRAGADVFVTADVRYHTFHQAAGRIALIDAGHYETEFPVVRTLARRLKTELARNRGSVPVYVCRTSTNPVVYV